MNSNLDQGIEGMELQISRRIHYSYTVEAIERLQTRKGRLMFEHTKLLSQESSRKGRDSGTKAL